MPPVAFPQAAPWAAVVSRLWVRSSPRPRGSVPPAAMAPCSASVGPRAHGARTDGLTVSYGSPLRDKVSPGALPAGQVHSGAEMSREGVGRGGGGPPPAVAGSLGAGGG